MEDSISHTAQKKFPIKDFFVFRAVLVCITGSVTISAYLNSMWYIGSWKRKCEIII